jgi:MFS family permease
MDPVRVMSAPRHNAALDPSTRAAPAAPAVIRTTRRGWLIWPVVILADAVMLLNFVTAPYYTQYVLDGTHAHLAWIGAAYWITYAPWVLLSARLGGRFGLRKLSLLGAALVIAASLAMAMSSTFMGLLLAMALLGLGGGALWPNIEAELSRHREGALLRRRLACFNIMWCAGTILGPLVGGKIYPAPEALAAGGANIFLPAFAASVIMGLLMAALLAIWRPTPPSAKEISRVAADARPRCPQRLKAFMGMSFLANFLAYIVLGNMRQVYEGLAKHQWGTSAPHWHSWLLVLLASASTLMFIYLFVAHRWAYRLKRLLFWQLAMAAGLIIAAMFQEPLWAAAGFLIIGVGCSFVYSGSLFYSVEGRSEQTHMAGWHEAFIGLGAVAGILGMGHAPDLAALLGITDPLWQLRSPYLLAAGLVVVGVVLELFVYLKHRPQFTPE